MKDVLLSALCVQHAPTHTSNWRLQTSQACSWSCQTTWERISCVLPSATSPAMARVSSTARTTTAGATVTPSSPSVTVPTWTSKPWRRVCRGSQRLGGSSTRSLRNQVTQSHGKQQLFSCFNFALQGCFVYGNSNFVYYKLFICKGRAQGWIQILHLEHKIFACKCENKHK